LTEMQRLAVESGTNVKSAAERIVMMVEDLERTKDQRQYFKPRDVVEFVDRVGKSAIQRMKKAELIKQCHALFPDLDLDQMARTRLLELINQRYREQMGLPSPRTVAPVAATPVNLEEIETGGDTEEVESFCGIDLGEVWVEGGERGDEDGDDDDGRSDQSGNRDLHWRYQPSGG